jgi:hypothetical protein
MDSAEQFRKLSFTMGAGRGVFEDYRKLQDLAGQSAIRWAQDSTELGKALETVFNTVGDGDFAKGTLDDIAKAAQASGQSVDTIAPIVAELNRQFGITKEDPNVKTPINPGTIISKADCPQVVDPERSTKGRSMIGSAAFAQVSHPGIRLAVSQLACIMHNPAPKHLKVAQQTIQYLYNTRSKPIVFRRGDWFGPDGTRFAANEFGTFVDSSYAPPGGDSTRKSHTGFAIMMNGGTIYAKSGVQSTVADSSAYAELIAMHQSVKETMAFRNTYH